MWYVDFEIVEVRVNVSDHDYQRSLVSTYFENEAENFSHLISRISNASLSLTVSWCINVPTMMVMKSAARMVFTNAFSVKSNIV
jgi:hypothetical protein